MFLSGFFICCSAMRLGYFAGVMMVLVAGELSLFAQPTNPFAPVSRPGLNLSRAMAPMPAGILAWDALSKTVDATNGQPVAHLTFTFTNQFTNPVSILKARPSCGCTTVEMPPVPWLIPAGATGQIQLSINLGGKVGTLFKSVLVVTDKGSQTLGLRVNLAPPMATPLTEAQRAAGIAAATVDRQAVFKGDCAVCHSRKAMGKFGEPLFNAVCAICHEANPRASMVPDLHQLPVATSEEYWRAMISAGKAGTLMPAFAISQGGPLNEIQIASLAAYLNVRNPSRTPVPQK
jgi:mono/diheme cytochrome c family protein